MKLDPPFCRDRVKHVIEAIENIEEFSASHTYASFRSDNKTISACLFQFSIIGEATCHIDREVLAKYAYPWHRVRAFRNFILREYFGIDIKLIWDTLTEILPELKSLMIKIFENEYSE